MLKTITRNLRDNFRRHKTDVVEKESTIKQAVNRANTWSLDQITKKEAMKGPRFEQIIYELQVNHITEYIFVFL